MNHEIFYTTIALAVPLFLLVAFFQDKSILNYIKNSSDAWVVLGILALFVATETEALFALADNVDSSIFRSVLLFQTVACVGLALFHTIRDDLLPKAIGQLTDFVVRPDLGGGSERFARIAVFAALCVPSIVVVVVLAVVIALD